MVVRFFGGFDFAAKDAQDRMPANIGYAKGNPIGRPAPGPRGQGANLPRGSPQDPIGANLDRIQIVKAGWMRRKLYEKVFDVAWLDNPSSTPRPASCRRWQHCGRRERDLTNSIASRADLVWKYPAFDPDERAFYYARVIEIPTPRWTAYDAKRFGVKPLPGTRMTITERAYTSPVWYTPN